MSPMHPAPSVRLLPCGPNAMLAEYRSLAQVMAVMRRLTADPPAGAIDIVPAARTILLTVAAGIDPAVAAASLVDDAGAPESADPIGPLVAIGMTYDGADLAEVAAACDLSVNDVIDLHGSAEYTVAFCGFVPGFSYLIGLDERLQVPRRASPRTRVPAGSVAIASEYTAVYPTETPGGWHLLGHTDAVMWDERRTVPALLPPGTRVRFVPT
jgi:KipI family sensor histidine kinase inhibitor